MSVRFLQQYILQGKNHNDFIFQCTLQGLSESSSLQDRTPPSPAIINVPTPISLSRLNDYGQQLAAAYFSPAGMAAAAAAAAVASAQVASVSPVAVSSNTVGSTTAIGGLGHQAAFLQHPSFFQKQHPSLSPPFVFPSGMLFKDAYSFSTFLYKVKS